MSSTTAKTAVTAAAQKKGRKSALSPETVEYLKSWMMSPEHIAHPYPTDHEKSEIMADTSIELKQLTNWFVNNRKRFWKPRVLDTKLLKKKFPRSDPGLVNGPGVGISPHPVFRGRPGLSIIVPQMNPKPQGARPIPSSAAPLYAQGTKGVKPAPAHNHPKIFGPAGIVASVNSPFGEDDLHTISDGSGSSACNSDDESVAASTPIRTHSNTFDATSAQYLDTRLTAATSSPAASTIGTTSLCSDGYRRREEVYVHVLRPEGFIDGNSEPLPTLRDLTIKSSVPEERILASFKCPISYTVPYDVEHVSRKVQSRRDCEVLRVKKHYLNLYLATRGIHSVSSPVTVIGAAVPSSRTSLPSLTSADDSTGHSAPSHSTGFDVLSTASRSRSFTCAELDQDKSDNSNPSPTKRIRTHSGPILEGEDEWRSLCQNARSVSCESLPGLDEAARMFGYISQ